MKSPTLRPVLIAGLAFLSLALALSACNMPGRRTPTPSGFDAINTAAAQTVVAQMTEISKPPPTQPAGAASATLLPGISTPVATLPAGSTAQADTACDQARFIADVTIPDNTVLAPGSSFVKTWRVQNSGTCIWTPAYAFVFSKGDAMGAPAGVQLTNNVAPGQQVDISVGMTAPTAPGTYKGDWKLRNAAGQIFGIGSKADPFYVLIKVSSASNGGGSTTTDGVDFVSSADLASWFSGVAPNLPGNPLTFGGPPNDPNGVARIEENLKLENGLTSGKLILTVPLQQTDGYVYGLFPAYTVRTGDRFKGRLGFATNPDGSCGAGRVAFQIAYLEGSSINVLAEYPKTCNGALLPIDLDLSALKGKTVQFVLAVRANGSTQDNWAIWNSPRIVR